MILELKNICKDYVSDKLVVPALKDVTIQIEEGEYVAIMGPSGSGKTTLMNIIGCLDRPTRGEFYLAGTDVSQLKDKELSNLRLNSIGFVFQSFHLMPRETAIENVSLPLSYAGVKKKERKERALKALARVGLEERATFMPTQLSGGQKQRVAIARAMVNNPKLLLADEPTGALDSKSGAQIMELFQRLNEEGVTILMITHDRNIANHAKRVYNIIDGEISEEGKENDKESDIEDEEIKSEDSAAEEQEQEKSAIGEKEQEEFTVEEKKQEDSAAEEQEQEKSAIEEGERQTSGEEEETMEQTSVEAEEAEPEDAKEDKKTRFHRRGESKKSQRKKRGGRA